MKGARITKRLVDGLKLNGSEYFIWDDKLTGFGIRVQASGATSYVVKYRAGSGRGAPTRRVTIARLGKVTPDEARDLRESFWDLLRTVPIPPQSERLRDGRTH